MLTGFEKSNRAAFIPFVLAGHPDTATSHRIIDTLVEAGADLIEIGVPFSDATADGPIIQAASETTAKVMNTLSKVLEFSGEIKLRHPRIPLVIFTYYNPIVQMGFAEFAEACAHHQIAAVLTVDLPVDESKRLNAQLAKSGVKQVFLASPTTRDDRIAAIAEASTGFLYYVSRTGVTGVQANISYSLAAAVAHLKRITSLPIAVGFGISTPEQAKTVARFADGVVVGSAFVKLISEAKTTDAAVESVGQLARAIAMSVKSAKPTNDN